MIRHDPAVLVLEDGTRYAGHAYGARGRTLGEAVFATGMTGYQETLTDPSYAGQIVVQTAPHIGNTGMNDEDPESRRIWVAGYVVRDPSRVVSNFRALRSLHRRRALVVVLTDLPDAGALDAEAAALRLAAGHRVVYAALNDPALAAAAEHAADDLERHAAKWLLEERAAHLATLADHATTLDLPAANGVGDLLRAWFTERRRL